MFVDFGDTLGVFRVHSLSGDAPVHDWSDVIGKSFEVLRGKSVTDIK